MAFLFCLIAASLVHETCLLDTASGSASVTFAGAAFLLDFYKIRACSFSNHTSSKSTSSAPTLSPSEFESRSGTYFFIRVSVRGYIFCSPMVLCPRVSCRGAVTGTMPGLKCEICSFRITRLEQGGFACNLEAGESVCGTARDFFTHDVVFNRLGAHGVVLVFPSRRISDLVDLLPDDPLTDLLIDTFMPDGVVRAPPPAARASAAVVRGKKEPIVIDLLSDEENHAQIPSVIMLDSDEERLPELAEDDGPNEPENIIRFEVSASDVGPHHNYKRKGRADTKTMQRHRWHCKAKGCPVNGYQPVGSNVVTCTGTHNHDIIDDARPVRRRVTQERKNLIQPMLRGGSTVSQVAVSLKADGHRVTKEEVKAVLYQQRREEGSLGEFLQRHPFVRSHCLKENGKATLQVFLCNEELLKVIQVADIEDIYIDGTRGINSQGLQLVSFLVHLPKDRKTIPLAHAIIVSCGKVVDYEVCFRSFRSLGVNPHRVHTDFESAEMAACKKVWPLARLAGCFFHFQQALMKRMSLIYGGTTNPLLGSIQEYGAKIFKSTTKEEAVRAIKELQKFCMLKKLDDFFTYFVKTWVEVKGIETFTQIGIPVHALEFTTNNPAEQLNNVMKGHFNYNLHNSEKRVIEMLDRFSKATLLDLLNDREKPSFERNSAAHSAVDRLLMEVMQDPNKPTLEQHIADFPHHIEGLLRDFRLMMVENGGRGHCQQEALAQTDPGFTMEQVLEMQIHLLRTDDRFNLLMHQTIVEQEVHLDGQPGEHPFIQALRTGQAWGNELTLLAYATARGRAVIVYHNGALNPTIILPLGGQDDIKMVVPAILYLEGEIHYRAVIPRENYETDGHGVIENAMRKHRKKSDQRTGCQDMTAKMIASHSNRGKRKKKSANSINFGEAIRRIFGPVKFFYNTQRFNNDEERASKQRRPETPPKPRPVQTDPEDVPEDGPETPVAAYSEAFFEGNDHFESPFEDARAELEVEAVLAPSASITAAALAGSVLLATAAVAAVASSEGGEDHVPVARASHAEHDAGAHAPIPSPSPAPSPAPALVVHSPVHEPPDGVALPALQMAPVLLFPPVLAVLPLETAAAEPACSKCKKACRAKGKGSKWAKCITCTTFTHQDCFGIGGHGPHYDQLGPSPKFLFQCLACRGEAEPVEKRRKS